MIYKEAVPPSTQEQTIAVTIEMNGRPSTVRDVARLARVSVATVSRVLNVSRNVSCETRTRVLSAISELRYSPNMHASELARVKGGVQRKLGILAPTLARASIELFSGPRADAQEKPKD